MSHYPEYTPHTAEFKHAYGSTHYDSLHTQFEMSSFIHSKDMTGAGNLEMCHVTPTTPTLVICRLLLHMINSFTKFEVSSFSSSEDISGGANF